MYYTLTEKNTIVKCKYIVNINVTGIMRILHKRMILIILTVSTVNNHKRSVHKQKSIRRKKLRLSDEYINYNIKANDTYMITSPRFDSTGDEAANL